MSVLNALYDNRSDPATRNALADYRLEQGERPGRLGVEIDLAAAAAAADADADATATADDADATTAATDAAADAIFRLNRILTQEPDMRDGLKIVQLPGGYYGYSITRVGWVRRVSGDDYELVGGRTMAREGQYSIDGITKAAAKGPNGYRLSVPDERPEELHRLLIRRAVPADEKAWSDAVPRPKGWRDE